MNETAKRSPVVLAPGEGRSYEMGRMRAVFKADGAETAGGYSISEWWLEPNTTGPRAHTHPEDDVFYVIEGTMAVLVDDQWIDAPKGSFVLIPAGITHDFENRSAAPAGALNFSYPGDFERHMPGIVQWYVANPAGDAVIDPPGEPPEPGDRSGADSDEPASHTAASPQAVPASTAGRRPQREQRS